MFSGRIDRLGYFLGALYTVLPIILAIAIYGIFNLAIGQPGSSAFRTSINILLFAVGAFSIVFILPISISLSIRRWHDLNQTGLLCLLTLVPYIGAVISFVLLFVPGTNGANNYGELSSPRGLLGVLFGKKSKTPPVAPAPIQPPQSPNSGSFGTGTM